MWYYYTVRLRLAGTWCGGRTATRCGRSWRSRATCGGWSRCGATGGSRPRSARTARRCGCGARRSSACTTRGTRAPRRSPNKTTGWVLMFRVKKYRDQFRGFDVPRIYVCMYATARSHLHRRFLYFIENYCPSILKKNHPRSVGNVKPSFVTL